MWQFVRRHCSLWALAALVSAGAPLPATALVTSASVPPFLLGTVEFRGVPGGGWYDFPGKVAEALDLLSRCAEFAADCPNPQIVALLGETTGLRLDRPHQMLAAVNRLVNRRPYRSDLVNFGKREHWASPLEFLDRSGDCEDSAIFKYALLRHLGLPADALRVVLLTREVDGLGHAVLAAYLDDQVYILDNLDAPVRPQSQVTNYTAVFSFNEELRWAHVASSPDANALPNDAPADRGSVPQGAGLQGSETRPLDPADSELFTQLYRAVFSSPAPDRGGYRVQLGAFRSLENANQMWQSVWRSQWDLLAGSNPQIHSLEKGENGQLHLLQIGALAGADTADSLCRKLSARGIDCLVVKPAETATRSSRT